MSNATRSLRLSAFAALFLGVGVLACAPMQAQDKSKDKCKPNAKNAACADKDSTDSAPPKSPHEAFPFPTDDSKHGGDAEPPAPTPSASGLPALPTGGDADPPASSEKPMHLPPGGYSGSSSSSSSNDQPADDDDDVAPTTAAPNAPVKAAPLKDLGSKGDLSAARTKLEVTRVADDLKVGRFYLDDGNTQGAYMRFKDAVDHDPGDPDARFYLAETAVKLNKHDEAVLNYREYLKLDPDGDHDKETRRALQKLGAGAQ